MSSSTGEGRISVERIGEASSVIPREFRNAPQVAFEGLSAELGADVVLKIETVNPIRSFKGRGAHYFVHCLTDETPLVVPSAGNFGQGMAYAARSRRIPLTVYAPEAVNPLKLARMRAFGARVTLQGHDFDAAKSAAREYAARHNWRFVEDGKEPAVTEGAGTIALELLEDGRMFDAVVVPVGNGAMINGMGACIKAHAPGTRVIGVCASVAPAMERSWRGGAVETTSDAVTIADGIAVRVPAPEAVHSMRDLVDDMLLVEDETIVQAMRLLLRHTGLVSEPSGAVGVAAILANRTRFAGQTIATPICGGNVAQEQIASWFA